MTVLETERLILRNFTATDLEEMWDYRNDARCYRYQRWQRRTKEELAQWIADRGEDDLLTDGAKQFAIAFRDSGEMLGELSVFLEDPTITLGYAISYKHHRRGYMSETLSELTRMLHARYPERELICLVEPENAASIALLKKLGFQDLGYAPKITSQVFGMWAKEDTEGLR